ncbi:uncharacterized protein BDR25DRAFT_354581 [Lindgomyces ingoldianus]|uniref:Uncharacterized protein n=1 Tax=Lindgomyces ingoldianus TaxID=673940 RepID=A0ACB6QWD8_9PLEO|nr:uncharacterized protein BDR25DRAFT_354581 [Lindgomyces ingoldianus]KAF2471339.1 hypothetical protein BDR25DRAFT_354581 [Lindgomyces ingoldianus]
MTPRAIKSKILMVLLVTSSACDRNLDGYLLSLDPSLQPFANHVLQSTGLDRLRRVEPKSIFESIISNQSKTALFTVLSIVLIGAFREVRKFIGLYKELMELGAESFSEEATEGLIHTFEARLLPRPTSSLNATIPLFTPTTFYFPIGLVAELDDPLSDTVYVFEYSESLKKDQKWYRNTIRFKSFRPNLEGSYQELSNLTNQPSKYSHWHRHFQIDELCLFVHYIASLGVLVAPQIKAYNSLSIAWLTVHFSMLLALLVKPSDRIIVCCGAYAYSSLIPQIEGMSIFLPDKQADITRVFLIRHQYSIRVLGTGFGRLPYARMRSTPALPTRCRTV